METARLAADGRMRAAPGAASPPDPGFLENASGLWDDLRGLAHDHLQLAALETQRAGKSLVEMVVYAVAAAILAVTAWLGLMAVGVLLLIDFGLNAGLALLLAVALNIAAACILLVMIRRSSEHLRFPATVRSLKSDASMIAHPDKS
jgi:uncharacterized membrane protein YqjE